MVPFVVMLTVGGGRVVVPFVVMLTVGGGGVVVTLVVMLTVGGTVRARVNGRAREQARAGRVSFISTSLRVCEAIVEGGEER